MKINKEMEEKIVVIIQALLGFLIIGLSIRSSVKVQNKALKQAWKKGNLKKK